MSTSAHELLAEALSLRFEPAGSRRAVVVLGAGLHHHLRRHLGEDPTSPEWKPFTDWNGLLASVAKEFGLPVVAHEDPAATWESLVVRLCQRSEGKWHAHMAESEALRAMSARLKDPPPMRSLAKFGAALASFRDVISLNVDDTVARALVEAGAALQDGARLEDLPRTLLPRATWRLGAYEGRLWQPHGSVAYPDGIVLGVKRYGENLARLDPAWVKSKQAERSAGAGTPEPGQWTPALADAWWARRRASPPYEPIGRKGRPIRLTWLDAMLGADLVFIGCSLDRAENDLWWALNARMRNLARVAPRARPRTFVVAQAGTLASHLATGPAGITTVAFQTHDEAWEAVLGPLR